MSPPLYPPFHVSNFSTKFGMKDCGNGKMFLYLQRNTKPKNNHHVYNYSRNNQESL